MQSTLHALADQLTELDHVLEPLSEADWHLPTRCDGWDVADVVIHLAQTNDLARASAENRFTSFIQEMPNATRLPVSIDDAADIQVASERGLTGPALLDRWQTSATTMLEALGSADPKARLTWVAGTLAPRTLATTRIAETWIHTGDVAHALGITLAPTDRLEHIARLAWRTLPYAFARAGKSLFGPVDFDLMGPAGQSWHFEPESQPATTIRGSAIELCAVAARRVYPNETSLVGSGPDFDEVLRLVRTYAQ